MIRVPEPKNGERRYGVWAGNKVGLPENSSRCIVEVPNAVGWAHHQCFRKRGHGLDGLYCKQHAKKMGMG